MLDYWGAFLHGAKAASPCADIPENHECCRLSIPAITHVRTRGAFANRVKLQVGDELFQFAIVLADGSGRTQPLRTRRFRRDSN